MATACCAAALTAATPASAANRYSLHLSGSITYRSDEWFACDNGATLHSYEDGHSTLNVSAPVWLATSWRKGHPVPPTPRQFLQASPGVYGFLPNGRFQVTSRGTLTTHTEDDCQGENPPVDSHCDKGGRAKGMLESLHPRANRMWLVVENGAFCFGEDETGWESGLSPKNKPVVADVSIRKLLRGRANFGVHFTDRKTSGTDGTTSTTTLTIEWHAQVHR